MTLIHTTIRPDATLDVDAAELESLTRQGLIVGVPGPTHHAPADQVVTYVSTTLEPDMPIGVGAAELESLTRQHLIAHDYGLIAQAGVAAGSGTAGVAVATRTAPAGIAAAAGAANPPTTQTSTNPAAEAAMSSATANPPTARISPTTGTAAAAGTAVGPLDAAATNLLLRMQQYQGTYALLGQQNSNDGSFDDQAYTHDHNGGRYAAIQGWDSSEGSDNIGGVQSGLSSSARSKIVSAWTTYGIIPTISQHWSPASATNLQPGDSTMNTAVTIANCFINGTTENTRYQAWKSSIADDLEYLAGQGVPVLFRPFHEAGFFWWSATTADYVRLWRDTYNYIVHTRGIHNTLWVWSIDGVGLDTNYYPGDHYVHIVAADIYNTNDYSATYTDLARYTAASKLRAMSEAGQAPPSPAANPFSWYLLWSSPFSTPDNTDFALTGFCGDASIITRDRVAGYLSGSVPAVSTPPFLDNFTTAATANWSGYDGVNATVTGGQLAETVNSSYTGAITSTGTRNLTGKSALIELVQPPNVGNGGTEFYFILFTGSNDVRFYWNNGTLYARSTVSGTTTTQASAAYNATNHRWLRISESAGTITWETSADGGFWTSFATWTNTITITALSTYIGCGYFGTETSPGSVLVDHYCFS